MSRYVKRKIAFPAALTLAGGLASCLLGGGDAPIAILTPMQNQTIRDSGVMLRLRRSDTLYQTFVYLDKPAVGNPTAVMFRAGDSMPFFPPISPMGPGRHYFIVQRVREDFSHVKGARDSVAFTLKP